MEPSSKRPKLDSLSESDSGSDVAGNQRNSSTTTDDSDATSPTSSHYVVGEKRSNGSAQPEASGSFAEKMMAKMGYKEGKGLGKYEQGRTEIVKESTHKGRRGLGVEPTGFETDFEKKWEEEEAGIVETVKWIPSTTKGIPSLDTMDEWVQYGAKKMRIDDETEFVDQEVLTKVLDCKTVFDNLEDKELRTARTRSNPFETIGRGIFQNRAAMKMANVDRVFDWMFSDPKKPNGESLIEEGEPLYFADVAAGPGGFTEYVLWRRFHSHGGNVKGFGFTLRGECDFKLDEFHSAPVEFFEPYYGLPLRRPGSDEEEEPNGDLTRPDNLEALQDVIMKGTGGKGVHFMMADGGFSVEGQENLQEILSKQLYLCQFIAAMSMLRTNGSFVCKLFDLFTPFSVGLVYLMWRSFRQITIHKPVTSRPANSERYIVCQHKLEDTEEVHEYLLEVNKKLAPLMSVTNKDKDIVEIVPLSVIKGDEDFYNFIRESNNAFGRVQSLHLEKIRAFAQNPNLIDRRQMDIKKECLTFWEIPNEMRKRPEYMKAHIAFPNMIAEEPNAISVDEIKLKPAALTLSYLKTEIRSVRDYRFYISGGDRVFLLGLGRENVFMWDGVTMTSGRPHWTKPIFNKTSFFKLELPRRTLLVAEIVQERFGEGKGQRISTAVHVTDALFVAGVDVRNLGFVERLDKARQMTRALIKLTQRDLTPIRTKEIHEFGLIEEVLQRQLVERIVKGSLAPRRCYEFSLSLPVDESRLILPQKIVLVRTTKFPWVIGFSKTFGREYWDNMHADPKDPNEQKRDRWKPPENDVAVSDFKYCQSKGSFYWPVQEETFMTTDELQSRGKGEALCLERVYTFIRESGFKR